MALECLFSGIGSSIVGKIFGSTFGRIGRQLGYLTSYRRNVKNLEDEDEILKVQKSRMDKLVKDAIDNCEEVYDDVKRWQEKVDKICKETEGILGDENHARIKCTFSGVFLNIRQRHRISREAKKKRESIVEIKGGIRFENISYLPKLKSNFDNKDFVTFDTRNETVRRITKTLGDANIRMIGVYGMSGSGKTTLVQEIAKRVLDEGVLFSDAVMVTVSRTPNLEIIQQEVARKLGLNLDNEASLSERAHRLKERLKKEEKLLLILDDVWNRLNLEEVGIAFKSDAKGCKILLTSRYERVLGIDMGVDENFPVELLSPEEAWDWFSNIVGHDMVKDNEFQRLGKDIVEECGRLPVAIKILAHEMKGRDLGSWSDALEQLRRSNLMDIDDMHEQVYSPIIFSFNSLQKDPQSLFLLCGVLQQNSSIKIEDLVRYAFGCDMFESPYTSLQDARNRVHHIINKLKDRCMLLDGDSHDMVRLHDLVHDVGIWFAKEKFMYCFKNDAEVEERLRRNALKDSVAILLPNDVNVHLLCQTLEYKELGIIRMPQNKSLQTPDHFFESTRDLRVLDLWYSKKLPSSLCSLGNLSTLCLRYARLESIAQIGEIQNLEILDLSWSKIKELPREIKQLKRLRMLDLRFCTQLKVIQASVIQHLDSLEELYVTNSFGNWDQVEVVHNVGERRNASLMELQDLAKLTTLHLKIFDVKMLPKHLSLRGNLERYQILVGDAEYTFNIIDDCSRYLGICKKLHESSDLLQERLQMFLKKPQVLYLHGIGQGVEEILYELSEKGNPELKQLRLENDDKIQCLTNSFNMGEIHRSVFCKLESLYLNQLRNLEKICHGEVTNESFQRLRDIEVHECPRLKNLLPASAIKKLEKLTIIQCDGMEEIVENYEDDNEEVIEIFPQLLSLSLIDVPKLSQFSSKLKKNHMSRNGDPEEPFPEDSVRPFFSNKFVSMPALNKFQLENCDCKKIWDDLPPPSTSFHNLTILTVKDCHFLKSLFSSAVAASFEQLEFLTVSNCKEMKEIVSRTGSMDKISFPQLNHLTLEHLHRLTTFSSSIFIDFPALTLLSIKSCMSQENSMPSLFNEKVSFPSLELFKVSGLRNLEMLWQNEHGSADSFCKLKQVDVSFCPNLVKMFPLSMQTRLGNLRELSVKECNMLQEVFEIQTINVHDEEKYHKLERVHADSCPSLKSIFPSASAAKGLSRLQYLYIENCGIEEIVGIDEGLGTVRYEFVFPLSKHLTLISLPNLVSFYRGPHTSRFPLLKRLHMEGCGKVEVLWSTTTSMSLQERHLDGSAHHDISVQQPPLFCTDHEAAAFPNAVTIAHMDNLKMIWQYELNSSTSDSFCKLESIGIVHCKNLTKIFPCSLERRLHNLRWLRISNCAMVEEIFKIQISHPSLQKVDVSECPTLKSIFPASVAKGLFQLNELKICDCGKLEEIVGKDEGLQLPDFVFPQLEEMEMRKLPNLVSFYRGPHTSRFPLLSFLRVSGLLSLQGTYGSLFFTNKATYADQSKDVVREEECSETFSHLKELVLSKLPNLMHLTTDSSQLLSHESTSFQHLERLQVLVCGSSSSISFRNLRILEVSRCHGMLNLLTSTIAKSMTLLKSIKISKCKRMTEIIAGDHNDGEAGEIVFSRLRYLKLDCLQSQSLKSFYSGNCTIKFPELERSVVSECFELQSFSTHAIISTQKLRALVLNSKDKEARFEIVDDINIALQLLIKEKGT